MKNSLDDSARNSPHASEGLAIQSWPRMERGWRASANGDPYPSEGFAGCFDFVDPEAGLRGWIVDFAQLTVAPSIKVWCGGHLFADERMTFRRSDIDEALGVSGNFGFPIPWEAFNLGRISSLNIGDLEAEVLLACPEAGYILPRIGEPLTFKSLVSRLNSVASKFEATVRLEGDLLERLIAKVRPGMEKVLATLQNEHKINVEGADQTPGVDRGEKDLDTSMDEQSLESHQKQLQIIYLSGLFDEHFYSTNNPDVASANVSLLEHYFYNGHLEGRNPNAMFDTKMYVEENPNVKLSGLHPLYHYLEVGEAEGRRPCQLFDPKWYRDTFNVPLGDCALAHYLVNRKSGRVSPIPEFDIEYYLRTYPDIEAAGIDPFAHYMESGYREGRNPSEEFDTQFYVRRYLHGDLSRNPLLHWLRHRHEPGIYSRMPENETTTHREIKRFTRPGPEFETFRPLPLSVPRRAKVLAYYLPQFHLFAENDRWWGKGFTEWTNLQRGVPRFKGHYQPRVPRDLGHYNLERSDVMHRQVELARAGGIHGFVFYYYWFNGKRLLERPVEAFLKDPTIEMPFALMWANENWTRRWDGFESEVLISQDYRPDDDARMVEEFVRHFRDPRYIRVQGRPLLMLYRPRLIPDAVSTVARWRTLFKDLYKEDPLLVMAQGFGDEDPTEFGLDGAIEFPPHKVAMDLPNLTAELDLLDPDFAGHVVSYDGVVQNSLSSPAPAYPLIKGAAPSWDNDARRQGTGMVLQGSTPAKYEAWLSTLADRAVSSPFFGEPFVVVNAWNEWAEGAYLEPDQHFGAAYLNATSRAVTSRGNEVRSKLLLIGHDAHPHGAQELLWNIGRTLRRSFGVDIEFLLLDGGELQHRYEEVAPTALLAAAKDLPGVLAGYRARGFEAAIVNTTAAARAVGPAAREGISITLLVHELPRIIGDMKLAPAVREALQHASSVVFPAVVVREAVLNAVSGQPPKAEIHVRPQGLYKPAVRAEADGARIRAALRMGKDDKLVLCVGYADLRKGFDLFLQAWRLMRRRKGPQVHFCWLGKVDISLRQWLGHEIESAVADGTFHLPGFTNEVQAYLTAGDVFALTSREDPFPSVALEAMCVGMPVVAFDKSGGIPELLKDREIGRVVPYCDVPAMVEAIKEEIECEAKLAIPKAEARSRLLKEEFVWSDYVYDLFKLAMPDIGSVSVAVPNYNYARYMPERLGSVFAQTHPVKEILVLDDCSTDGSLEAIERVAAEWKREIRLIANKTNSGSVFAQWRKSAEEATGEFVWIAEADDASDPAFLSRTISLLRSDPKICFAFTDSRSIDTDGNTLGPSYKQYYETVEPGALEHTEIFDAAEFVSRFLSVKNLILNVSAVVWRRDALLRALDRCGSELLEYRMAGDWRLYLETLTEPGARVAYDAKPLNVHRRHAQSVTHALKADLHLAEIARIQALATDTFQLGPAIQQTQNSYLEQVAVQLGGTPLNRTTTKKATSPDTAD